MKELIERLERATEGSRQLELEIHLRLNFSEKEVEGFDWGCIGDRVRFADGSYYYTGDWPDYTTSIDAALTLVPHGVCWKISGSYVEFEMEYRAEVDYGDGVWKPTPALALCIAALKARDSLRARSKAEE